MPIPFDRLQQSLSKAVAPVYLVAGDEPLLVQEAADAIRKAARDGGCAEREVLHAEDGFDWNALASAGANMSLFSERRLIELHLGSSGAGREGSAAIREYCEHCPDDVVLLVRGGEMDRRAKETSWVKAIEKAGQFVYGWAVPPRELPEWVMQRMRAAGLGAAGMEMAVLIAERNEGNLLACAQEVEKLVLLMGPSAGAGLSEKILKEAINDGARFGSFDLVDKLLAGDRAGALRSLYRLREEGEDPLAILGALGWSIRCMARLASAGDRVPDKMFSELKLFGDRRSRYQRAASRLGAKRAEAAILQIAVVDAAAKGARSQKGRDAWNELLELVLTLMPPQRRSA